jgi:haloalkane dehalogenase
VANTFLPTGDRHPGDAFLAWQRYSQETPSFRVGRIVNGGCASTLAPEVIAAYDAPYPDDTYKEGARQFPMLVPTSPDDPASDANRAAWKVLAQWDKPFLTAFSDADPITAGGEKVFQSVVPGARRREHPTIKGAGHFLQEDKGEELAAVVVDFVRSTA